MKRRTSVLIEETLLNRAREVLGAASNTEAITEALRTTLANAEIARRTEELLRKGRGRFADAWK
jgi:hypothetical protein